MSGFSNHHFPAEKQTQHQRLISPLPSPPESPPNGGLNRSAAGVARGELGTGYGPYAYEHGASRRDSNISSASAFTTPYYGEKESPTKVAGHGLGPNTATLPLYMWAMNEPEDDDDLHAPSPTETKLGLGRRNQKSKPQPLILCSLRGFINVGTLSLLLVAVLMLFVGYPVILQLTKHTTHTAGFNLGGINSSGQIPDLPGLPSLIDKTTPQDVRSRVGADGKTYNLVFSDEFATDGRSFYPGDDPYWEAMDFHYWATGDYEWYDPSAVTTEDGNLVITLSKKDQHDLNYMSGMIQSWNKFCFSSGYVEVSVSLPGSPTISGLWPGVWMMGNLGRAGYGATTDGLWPYSYSSCDVGTFPNQMDKSGNPSSSATDGYTGSLLSKQPGQRLSACTCPGSDHPGPSTSSGRGAPELDIFEATVDSELGGEVSQSLQVAPFNAEVKFDETSPATTVYDSNVTSLNGFVGTNLQQTLSALTVTDHEAYGGSKYSTYGVEFWGGDDGYITWYSDGKKTWGVTSAAIGPDSTSEVDQRLIPEEPMYLIMNLGISASFATVDFDDLTFPTKMYVDYVRVYQRSDVSEGVGCNPSHHPTANYITNHPKAYTDANMTTWSGAGYLTPRNSEYDGC